MSASHKDPALDAALLALARGAEARDDEAWVKRVASRVGPFAGTPLLSRTELDALLAAPADDDADVGVGGDFDHGGHAGDDHAAHAADHSHGVGGAGWDDASLGKGLGGPGSKADERDPLRVSQTSVKRESVHMEESMSEEEAPKKNDLGALAGLTRSSLAAPAPALGEIDGAAKGDDSGRIDLRAMLGGESSNDGDAAAAAATASAVGKPDDNVIDIGAIQRASAPPKSSPKADSKADAKPDSKAAPSTGAAVISTAAGSAPAASAAVAAKPADKKGGVVWIGVALAAAAAVGVGVITLSGKKSEETASKAGAPAAAAEKKDDKAVAMASASATTAPAPTVAMADPAPTAAASGASPTPAPDPKVDPKMAGNGGGTAAPPPGTGTAPAKTAPAASASAKPAPTNDPIHKPSGGSLDDVLGIGKEDPSKKPVLTADPSLPEKPDTGDIRSAVLGKQGAAQACVKGLDGDSSVAVTFGPAGNVTAVVVTSGPAKGTGAEACIKNAFNGAKVPASKKGGTGYAKLLP